MLISPAPNLKMPQTRLRCEQKALEKVQHIIGGYAQKIRQGIGAVGLRLIPSMFNDKVVPIQSEFEPFEHIKYL